MRELNESRVLPFREIVSKFKELVNGTYYFFGHLGGDKVYVQYEDNRFPNAIRDYISEELYTTLLNSTEYAFLFRDIKEILLNARKITLVESNLNILTLELEGKSLEELTSKYNGLLEIDEILYETYDVVGNLENLKTFVANEILDTNSNDEALTQAILEELLNITSIKEQFSNLSTQEEAILRKLLRHGYNYLVKSEDNNYLLAYEKEPYREDGLWVSYLDLPYTMKSGGMFKKIKPNNRKPFDIKAQLELTQGSTVQEITQVGNIGTKIDYPQKKNKGKKRGKTK